MQDRDDPWGAEGKKKRLKTLFREWENCNRCRLCETRSNIVFGNGSAHAEIMLIGEGPGETEDKTGNVFVGESGLLLNAILQAAKIPRDDLFITNLVMCRPPGEGGSTNRSPMRDEREACLERLFWQIYIVDPMLIIPVGADAMQALMGGAWKSIQREQGKFGYIELAGLVEDVIRYPAMPILHPAFINREDKINRETKNWEQGGWAHKTYKSLVKARQRVERLKEMYRPAQLGSQKATAARRGLRVVQ